MAYRREVPPKIYIDADACPVKEEVYRVARRHRIGVVLVANARMRIPDDLGFELVVVNDQLDAADDWIVARVEAPDIVISADVPLAARCLEKGAAVLGPTGRAFTLDTIGDDLATRDLRAHLRELGAGGGGPAPFDARDRSRFLQNLHTLVEQALRQG